MAKFFGEVPGNPVGSTFASRAALSRTRVHRPLMGGISGNGREGADSIVVSGGYIDDQDFGDELIYTGHGGNDPGTKQQIADQELDAPGNAGLARSQLDGLPVRVIRGAAGDSAYSPPTDSATTACSELRTTGARPAATAIESGSSISFNWVRTRQPHSPQSSSRRLEGQGQFLVAQQSCSDRSATAPSPRLSSAGMPIDARSVGSPSRSPPARTQRELISAHSAGRISGLT